MSEARVHAITASELLAGITRAAARLDELTEDQRLQMAATGGYARHNADMRWTVELALANALTALALSMTEERPIDLEAPEP
jgi:hypothetical protein